MIRRRNPAPLSTGQSNHFIATIKPGVIVTGKDLGIDSTGSIVMDEGAAGDGGDAYLRLEDLQQQIVKGPGPVVFENDGVAITDPPGGGEALGAFNAFVPTSLGTPNIRESGGTTTTAAAYDDQTANIAIVDDIFAIYDMLKNEVTNELMIVDGTPAAGQLTVQRGVDNYDVLGVGVAKPLDREDAMHKLTYSYIIQDQFATTIIETAIGNNVITVTQADPDPFGGLHQYDMLCVNGLEGEIIRVEEIDAAIFQMTVSRGYLPTAPIALIPANADLTRITLELTDLYQPFVEGYRTTVNGNLVVAGTLTVDGDLIKPPGEDNSGYVDNGPLNDGVFPPLRLYQQIYNNMQGGGVTPDPQTATNTAAITVNTAAIATNTSDTQSQQTEIDSNSLAHATNASDIAINTGQITTLWVDVNQNGVDIADKVSKTAQPNNINESQVIVSNLEVGSGNSTQPGLRLNSQPSGLANRSQVFFLNNLPPSTSGLHSEAIGYQATTDPPGVDGPWTMVSMHGSVSRIEPESHTLTVANHPYTPALNGLYTSVGSLYRNDSPPRNFDASTDHHLFRMDDATATYLLFSYGVHAAATWYVGIYPLLPSSQVFAGESSTSLGQITQHSIGTGWNAYTGGGIGHWPTAAYTPSHSHVAAYTEAGVPEIVANTHAIATKLDIATTIKPKGTAPTSETDTGTEGEIRWDSEPNPAGFGDPLNYIYLCIATDTWERIQTSTWVSAGGAPPPPPP